MSLSESCPRPFPFISVSGGCRSGKSAFAQDLAEGLSRQRLFLATCVPGDEDMRERVRKHQAARGRGWRTHELAFGQAPSLSTVLPAIARPGETILLDCLSLWASGCMDGEHAPPDFGGLCDQLVGALWHAHCPVIIVISEVGLGVVPSTRAGRVFRDMNGIAAQKAAARAHAAVLTVSGLPLLLKGELPLMP